MFHNYILKFILLNHLQYSSNPLSWHDSQQHCLQCETCEHRFTTSQLKNNMTLFFLLFCLLFFICLFVCFINFIFWCFYLNVFLPWKRILEFPFVLHDRFILWKRSLVGCVQMNKIWYKFFDVIKVMYNIWIGWCIYIL